MIRNHYDTLGLNPGCSKANIKESHLKLSILLDNQKVYTGDFLINLRRNIDEAYSVLVDEELRQEHDEKIFRIEKIIADLKGKITVLERDKQQLNLRVKETLDSIQKQKNRIDNMLLEISELRDQNLQLTSNGSFILIPKLVIYIFLALFVMILLNSIFF